MLASLRVGQRIPPAYLSRLDSDGVVQPIHSELLFSGGRLIVVGAPGAFTPVCAREHLPSFLANAPALRAAGRALEFVSDGNLDFARACGLAALENDLFLGERSRRYVLELENAVVQRMRVEQDLLSVTCTRAQDILELD
ncbi:MAG: hypothetical protein DCF16_11565 [Alphaproteobacteria bacterium]|nr:MAG: hypothetical protein DCF16_11565 [Alphaproteobacteria bacterium]